MSGRARGGLLIALFVLLAAWLLAPAGVPLYDGVGFPDEPYRWVAAPAGTGPTPAPTEGSSTARMRHGTMVDGLAIASSEQAPQVQVFLPIGSLTGPAGSTTVTARVTPVAGDSASPGMIFDGNVYSLSARTDAPGTPSAGLSTAIARVGGYVQFRSPLKPGVQPEMVYRATKSDPWRVLTVFRSGQDTYGSNDPSGLGDYALAFGVAAGSPPASGIAPPAHRGGASTGPLYWLAGGIVVLLALILVGARAKGSTQK